MASKAPERIQSENLQAPALWRRSWAAGAMLLGIYLVLSLAYDPRGSLGTDTGGKVATVKVMSERADFDPDVGYWARDLDPDGRFHGLIFTTRYGDRYIQVTTLPMVLAARPLWDLGGYRAALALPMIGGVLAAGGARALARRLGDGDGFLTFWVVGLGSPVAVYSLDLWEHTLGLALCTWGVVALFDVAHRSGAIWKTGLAGAAFGWAFSMRTEAAIYGAATLVVTLVAMRSRRPLRDLAAMLLLWSGGVLATVGANLLLELTVLGEVLRTARAANTASDALDQLPIRLQEALITVAGVFPSADPAALMLGAIFAGCLVAAACLASRGHTRSAVVVAASAVGLYLLRLFEGLGFVPGLLPTTPLAALGLAIGWNKNPIRFVLCCAVAPMPLVFATQYTGGALPQWGGRYLLVSGLLLTVVGLAERRALARSWRVFYLGCAFAITFAGLAWGVARTQAVGRAIEQLRKLDEPLLVAENGFLPREFGSTYPEQHWFGLSRQSDREVLYDLIDQVPVDRFGVVLSDSETNPPQLDGWRLVGTVRVPFAGSAELTVALFSRAEAAPTASE
ncbi:MAG: hypothetical protein N2037_05500 [Acidimicrobiales bacterium]|nr:hypothetical protein [Acidimicrobiales bacterium]